MHRSDALTLLQRTRTHFLLRGLCPPSWSPTSQHLFEFLDLPLTERPPAPYRSEFVARYVPNQSAYLPEPVADRLQEAAQWKEGRWPGQFFRAVDSSFEIDFSWSSTQLDEHRFTLEQTASLFQLGDLLRGSGARHPCGIQALVNHKRAVERLMAIEKRITMNVALVTSFNELLLDRLLDDPQELGHLRRNAIPLGATAFEPLVGARAIHDELSAVVAKAAEIRNPIEASFFLWVHISYLQPFLEGNEATARLIANLPLTFSNCAPLTFNGVGQRQYRAAMLGIYERNDVSAAIDVFVWTYRESIRRYGAALRARPLPDPCGLRLRDELMRSARAVVVDGQSAAAAIAAENLSPDEAGDLAAILSNSLGELSRDEAPLLDVHESVIDDWISAGRPH